MTASAWDKFLLLSWKNWIIQIRHPIQTAFEVFVPVAVCALLIVIRGLVEVNEFSEDFLYKPDRVNVVDRVPFDGLRILTYSPENDVLHGIIDTAAKNLNFNGAVGFANAELLQNNATLSNPFASIEFDDSWSTLTDLPDVVNYAIRFPAELRSNNTNELNFAGFFFNWATNFRLSNEFSIGPRNQEDNDGGNPPGYIPQGFIAIQNAIEREIIYLLSDKGPDDLPQLEIQRYPYPAYTQDIIGFILEFAFPFLFLIAFLYNTINIIKYIAVEKELQLKEAMKIMGLPSYMHWLAWFTKCMIFMIVIISILTGMFKIQFADRGGLAIFTFSNWFIIWLFLFLYVMAAVTYSFMFTTFFNRANIASIVGAIVWFVLLLPFTLINQNYNNISTAVKLAASLLCNTGMGLGIKVISQYETAGVGVQWDNLFRPVSPDDDLTLGAVMIVLLIASAVQMLITLYVEKIKPGEFGVAEPWYFPVTPKFWTGKVKGHKNEEDLMHKNNSNFEAEPVGKKAGIQVRGLNKVYDKKVAVKNLNLNMYEDQITVLLGHNGAGKSTTMSMLTGLFSPTAGTAYIDGKDIRTDLNSIRGSLGLCPQHNVLFNELTVREHITFFSKLKGLKKKSEIEEQIRKYVNLLELMPKINAQSSTLSGGMKRKLSIGIALCGDSKIVMCDEPTSGMDPAARRALWDLLIQEKKGRTILLTTHFMDEADVLGDRIAIMAEGDLKTVGSSFFLKKKFGVGYRLVCVKAAGCDPSQLTALLATYIPSIQIETNIGSELTYVLNESYVTKFKTIFADLEGKTSQLKISSFGVSLTTLEEVFLKVGTDTNILSEAVSASSSDDLRNEGGLIGNYNARVNGNSNGTLNSSASATRLDDNAINASTEVLKMEHSNFLRGSALHFSQIKAMVSKKYLYSIRNWVLLLIQFVIPAFFIVITMLTDSISSGNRDLPELPIAFETYLETVTVLERGTFAADSVAGNVFNNYQAIINGLPEEHSLMSTGIGGAPTGFQDAILALYGESVSRTNLNYMVGATIGENITAWFNNQGYHTAALTINLINNAILRSVTGKTGVAINVVNKPLPFNTETRITQLGAGNNLGFNIAFNTGFGLAFVTAMFVMFFIKERVSRAKLLQFVSGANKTIFWLTSFVIDYFVFFLICLLYIAVLAAYQKEGYSEFAELARNFLLIIIFGIAVLPYTYVASFMFQIPSSGLVRLAIGYIVSGVFFFMAVFILSNELFRLQYISDPLGWVFLIFPHYSLASAMSNLNVQTSTIRVCNTLCTTFEECAAVGVNGLCDQTEELECTPELISISPIFRAICTIRSTCCGRDFYSFDGDGISKYLVALGVVAIVSFIFLFMIEYRWIQNLLNKLRKPKRLQNVPESEDGIVDSDVMAEKTKIRSVTSFLQASNNLVVKDFTKYYGKMLAVNQICVGVEKGECFGLLGVNGAGKTSTFKMLTGDESISSGEAWVDGISVKTDMNKVHKRIGYCPQFDALLDDLTGRETLRIFALLRGVPGRDIKRISEQLADEFNFTKHLDKRIKAYSGGNKRKLSTALSLIGDPTVIYLDEPTSGMDVGARRQLWNMVIKARNAGKSVVLTSHSMEECEVLCTRLAIMVNGEFKCLGSTQHLKNKFSKGFFLTIKIGTETNLTLDEKILNVKNFVTQNFSGAALKEEYMDILTYQVPSTDIKWSSMFGLMEDAKARLNINDYTLGQTSLEQVFLYFTKYQRVTK